MDVAIEFTPEKAWLAAVDNLQINMPRAVFEARVNPSHLEDFNDNTFIIGCANSNGRDWLAVRLTSTLERFLSGVMNRDIKIRFLVSDQARDQADPNVEEDLDRSETKADQIGLDISYSSIRDYLLDDRRVARLPVYYLRWLPYVHSQIIFIVIALWQEYYLASGGNIQKGNNRVCVRAERVCRWTGISRAQFFRLSWPGSGLGWFVRKTDTEYEVDKRTGHTKKSSNQYILINSPLTPGDTEDLKIFLLTKGIQESPAAALQAALTADLKQILKYPVQLPSKTRENMSAYHATVQEIVIDLIGCRLTANLITLTDQLADRLLTRTEFILVSWYFLNNWLPALGAEAAMFVLFLRNLCYFNDETGELRDEILIEGGYEAIAQCLGIKNPRTVANWLPAKIGHGKRNEGLTDRTGQEFARRQRLQNLLSLFVKRIDHRINSSGNYLWKFKVQRVDPLTLQHETIRRVASSLLVASKDQGVLDELGTWLTNMSNNCAQPPRERPQGDIERSSCETVKNGTKVVLRFSEFGDGCSETLAGILNDCSETLGLEDKGCFETLLKILNRFKDSLTDKDTPSTQDSSNALTDGPFHQTVRVMADTTEEWSLEKLLVGADKKNCQILLEQEKNALPFVSWLIHGASQASIQNPYGLAIAKRKENPRVSTGGASSRLAASTPQQMGSLIEQALIFRFPSNQNWRILFAQAKRDRILLLADSLGLKPDIEAVT